MPIPERFRRRPSPAEMREFTALCREIEDGLETGADVSDKLERWNRRSGRTYAPRDFKNYYSAVSTETFVNEALLGRAQWVDDLTYAELEAVMEAVCNATLSEAELGFYLEWLDANLPGVGVIDLLDYPEQWFGYVPRLASPMTPRQLLEYAMHRAGRTFPDAPGDVTLPVPHPGTPEGEAARRAARREEAWAHARDWAKAWAEARWSDAASMRGRLDAALTVLPDDDLPELRELIGRRGAACLQGMRELGLVPAQTPAQDCAPAPALSPAPAESDDGPARVERVSHPKFGVGVVKARYGVGPDAKLEIAFGGEVRRLLARFVTPVDECSSAPDRR